MENYRDSVLQRKLDARSDEVMQAEALVLKVRRAPESVSAEEWDQLSQARVVLAERYFFVKGRLTDAQRSVDAIAALAREMLEILK